MKKKDKIIGILGILGICIVLFIGGYVINLSKDNNYKDVFEDYDIQKTETVYKSKEKNQLKDQEKESKEKNIGKDTKAEGEKNKNISIKASDNDIIKIDIKGAIKTPGVYTLNKDSRIEDIINLAGGFLKEADTLSINLSKKLEDEEFLYIPRKGEKISENLKSALMQKGSNDVGGTEKKKDGKININKATLEELKTLPSIGETRANSIIKYREENGGFKSVEELKNISGIGDKTLDKFIDKVDIN